MEQIKSFLISMLSQPGLSGFEEPVARLIAEQWKPLVDEISATPLGSLHAWRKADGKEKKPTLMIAAHMDAIGLMVKKIENGLLFVTNIGGVDPHLLPGQLVTVHGKKDLPGVMQFIPDRLMNGSANGKVPGFERLFIDTGLSEKELATLVRPGDLASFAQPPFELEGGYLAGHSLDNRASVAAVTVCLEELCNTNLNCNLVAAATTREETNAAGAATSSFGLRPDAAIVVDVTFAKGPGASDYRCFPLGGGPSIGTGPNNHPALVRRFSDLAEEMDMPFSLEAMPVSSGTDGMAIQVSASGVPLSVLGVAIRYMHSSVEMVSMKDIRRTGRLMARFIAGLTPETFSDLFEEEQA